MSVHRLLKDMDIGGKVLTVREEKYVWYSVAQ